MEICVYSQNYIFKKYIRFCLENENENDVIFRQKRNTNIIIIDAINCKDVKQFYRFIDDKKTKKIIFLESGNDLYLNTNCKIPYSVYQQFDCIGDEAENLIDIEEKLVNSNKDYVIFRVSELYGPNIKYGLIYDLFHKKDIKINDGYRDFIYEGDLLSAIDVAINNNIVGKFDIASGKRTQIRDLIDLIKKYSKNNISIEVDSNIFNVEYNCDNFKYYKWEALVQIETGFKTIKNSFKL